MPPAAVACEHVALGTLTYRLTAERLGLETRNSVDLVPGSIVRHPGQPDWGLGQVQSAIGERITVNFEHAGKVLIDSRKVELEVVDAEEN